MKKTNKHVDSFEDYASKFLTKSSSYETPKNTSQLERYVNKMESVKTLTYNEERKLAKDIQNGNQEALMKLVEPHVRDVIQLVKQINTDLHPELIHEGNLGLIEAGKEYDGKSIFRKFAKPYVIKYIQKELAEHPDNYKDPYVEPSKTRVRVCGTCLVNRKHQTT
jgi:DNA-directed RNA polymerase sigma subunit (sigma70/sigma32)